ncbi:MAG: LCP family protein [Candidatus Coatesbacteria bacterium]|nr:LCP family protein [Candidatus Coatesbacteria bacterium]
MGYYNRKTSRKSKYIIIILIMVIITGIFFSFIKCSANKGNQGDSKNPVKINMQQAAKLMTSSIDTSSQAVKDEINILALGLDTRAGQTRETSRADAIILITVYPRKAKFEILAFGRDMEVDTVDIVDKQGKPIVRLSEDEEASETPEEDSDEKNEKVDKKPPDETKKEDIADEKTEKKKETVKKKKPGSRMDKIAHVYLESRGGREKLIKVVEKLSHKKVDYYAEVGFSQIIGLMNFLGLNGVDALKYLRHRKSSLAPNTYQRAMNQATFIRYAAVKYFPKAAGFKRTFVVSSFSYLSTNMKPEVALGCISLLEKRGVKKENFTVSVFNYNAGIKDNEYDPSKVSEYLSDWQKKHVSTTSQSDFKIAARIFRAIKDYEDSINEIKELRTQKPKTPKDRKIYLVKLQTASSKNRNAVKRAKNFFEQQLWWQEPDKVKQQEAKKALITFMEDYYKKQIEIYKKALEKANLSNNKKLALEKQKKNNEEALKQLYIFVRGDTADIEKVIPAPQIIVFKKK